MTSEPIAPGFRDFVFSHQKLADTMIARAMDDGFLTIIYYGTDDPAYRDHMLDLSWRTMLVNLWANHCKTLDRWPLTVRITTKWNPDTRQRRIAGCEFSTLRRASWRAINAPLSLLSHEAASGRRQKAPQKPSHIAWSRRAVAHRWDFTCENSFEDAAKAVLTILRSPAARRVMAARNMATRKSIG